VHACSQFNGNSVLSQAEVAQAVKCLTTGRTIGRSRFNPRQSQRIFPLAPVSRPALGPTQPPVQWVSGVLSPGVKRGCGMTLTSHLHLVSRTRMSRSYIPPLHLSPSWRSRNKFTFLLPIFGVNLFVTDSFCFVYIGQSGVYPSVSTSEINIIKITFMCGLFHYPVQ
jgi:hypothetical protein